MSRIVSQAPSMADSALVVVIFRSSKLWPVCSDWPSSQSGNQHWTYLHGLVCLLEGQVGRHAVLYILLGFQPLFIVL